MTNLQAFANDLKIAAGFLPKNYNDLSVDELAVGYCEAVDTKNDLLKESYFAGLFLKFWYLIDKLYKENGTALRMAREDFISWIEGAILQACTERAWVNNPKLKVQQIIQKIIATRYKAMAYYESNLLIHKANFGTDNLDVVLDEDNDTTMLDLLESRDLSPSEKYNSATDLIQRCLDNNKVIEAIIAETIANNDCTKRETHTVVETDENGFDYKYIKATEQFWPYKVVKLLSTLPDNYENYFLDAFKVDPNILKVCVEKIKKSNNTKLYEYLSNTQEYLRNCI